MKRPPYISDAALGEIVSRGLAEDVGRGDVTTQATVPASLEAEAAFLSKESGVVAGLEVAERTLRTVDPALHITWELTDGHFVNAPAVFGTVRGKAQSILTAERLTLNLLQRMSGIASATNQMVRRIKSYPAKILDTRKTVPGLRPLDKWAVLLGGGENHRIGLFDMILIKDNHITASGSIRKAVEAAVRYRNSLKDQLPLEVEATTLDQVQEILEAGPVDFILLDNMFRPGPDGHPDASLLKEAVELVDGRTKTEASGNVTLEHIETIASTGVDFISCGALTHSVRALDISLKIRLV